MTRRIDTAAGAADTSAAASVAAGEHLSYDLRAARRLVASRARSWLVTWAAVALVLALTVPAGVGAAVHRWGTLETSVWEYAGNPLGWAVFALAVIVGSVSLPLFVAYGISRRAVLQVYAVVGAGIALGCGLLMAVGYAVEGAVYSSLGVPQALDGSHLYAAPTEWALVVAEHGLRGATMLLTGWVVGLVFYRVVWWVGLVWMTAAFVPFALGSWALAAAPTGVATATLALGTAVLVVAAYRVAYDLPIKAKRG